MKSRRPANIANIRKGKLTAVTMAGTMTGRAFWACPALCSAGCSVRPMAPSGRRLTARIITADPNMAANTAVRAMTAQEATASVITATAMTAGRAMSPLTTVRPTIAGLATSPLTKAAVTTAGRVTIPHTTAPAMTAGRVTVPLITASRAAIRHIIAAATAAVRAAALAGAIEPANYSASGKACSGFTIRRTIKQELDSQPLIP